MYQAKRKIALRADVVLYLKLLYEYNQKDITQLFVFEDNR